MGTGRAFSTVRYRCERKLVKLRTVTGVGESAGGSVAERGALILERESVARADVLVAGQGQAFDGSEDQKVGITPRGPIRLTPFDRSCHSYTLIRQSSTRRE